MSATTLSWCSKSASFLTRVAILGAAVGALAVAAPASAEPDAMKAAYAHRGSTHRRHESIDERIAYLHGALKITPEEDGAFGKVAETMRWNEAAMQKLIATHKAEPENTRTAIYDLKTYEAFSRAHLEGLKDLIGSFEALYAAMPADQKRVADHVFRHYGRHETSSRS